jgi:hypothetical protein
MFRSLQHHRDMLALPVSRLAHFALPPNQDGLAQPSARLEPVLGIENWRKGLREIEGALPPRKCPGCVRDHPRGEGTLRASPRPVPIQRISTFCTVLGGCEPSSYLAGAANRAVLIAESCLIDCEPVGIAMP